MGSNLNLVSEEKHILAICKINIANIYTAPDRNSPLLTQLLFGECVYIIRRKNYDWVRVLLCDESNIGWMHPNHIYSGNGKKELDMDVLAAEAYSLELLDNVHNAQYSLPIPMGSSFYKCDGLNVKMPFGRFLFSGQIVNRDQAYLSVNILSKLARRFLHAPYVKGGRSVLGMDPSGFVQLVYKIVGIDLGYRINEKIELGYDVGFVSQAEIGDLAFCVRKSDGKAHLGIIIGPMTIIHVHDRVKIDQIDQQGIFDLEKRRYTYTLRTLRRIINP